jgi:hypothetical protein
MSNTANWSSFTTNAEKRALTDYLFSCWGGLSQESLTAVVDMCFDAGWKAMSLHVSDVKTCVQEASRKAFLEESGVSETAIYLDALGTLLDAIGYASEYNYKFALSGYSYENLVSELVTGVTLLLSDERTQFRPRYWLDFLAQNISEENDVENWVKRHKPAGSIYFRGMDVAGTLSDPFVERVSVPMVAWSNSKGDSPLVVVVGAIMAQGALCRSHVNGLRMQDAVDRIDVQQLATTDGSTLFLPEEPLLMAMAQYCADKMDASGLNRGRTQLGGSTLTQILENAGYTGVITGAVVR